MSKKNQKRSFHQELVLNRWMLAFFNIWRVPDDQMSYRSYPLLAVKGAW